MTHEPCDSDAAGSTSRRKMIRSVGVAIALERVKTVAAAYGFIGGRSRNRTGVDGFAGRCTFLGISKVKVRIVATGSAIRMRPIPNACCLEEAVAARTPQRDRIAQIVLCKHLGANSVTLVDRQRTLVAGDKFSAKACCGRGHQRVVCSTTGDVVIGQSENEAFVFRSAESQKRLWKPCL